MLLFERKKVQKQNFRKMAKHSEYSELAYDDFSLKYRSSYKNNQKFFSPNNLVIFILFTFIGIISLFFILSFNRFSHYYNKYDSFIPLDLSSQSNSTITLEPYFDSRSQLYHLAQDQSKSTIEHKYQKLNTSFYCFKEGTNWNESLAEGKCVCKPKYSLQDCGLSDQVKMQLLRKQSSCHFKQDIVNIERNERPSKIIFAMPLYDCEKKNCNRFIEHLVNEYESIVDLFVFTEIRSGKQQQTIDQSTASSLIYNQLNNPTDSSIDSTTSSANLAKAVDERVHLFSLNLNKPNQDLLNDKQQANLTATTEKASKEDNQMTTNQNTKQFKNVIYQIKTLDLEKQEESLDINKKIYKILWNLVFNNVANYRSQDKILFLPPFNTIEKPMLNFFKFYSGYGEPIVLVDKFYISYTRRHNLPNLSKEKREFLKSINDDLNSVSLSVMMTFQYSMNVCKYKFDNFQSEYCLRNYNLVQNFEKKFWKVCKRTATSLDSNPLYF